MKKSEKCNYRFTVKETGDGKPWLMLEPMDCELSIFKDLIVGLKLRDDMTIEEAQELSKRLNKDVSGISYTRL